MAEFTDILNGMDADSRAALIASAEKFVRQRGDYDTCVFCGKSLTDLVCDAPIGFEVAGYKEPTMPNIFNKESTPGYRFIDSKSEMFTCDLPVCEGCRTQGSAIFMCGEKSEILVPDLCPLHRERGPLSGNNKMRVLTTDEVVAWRQRALMMLAAGKLPESYPETDNHSKPVG